MSADKTNKQSQTNNANLKQKQSDQKQSDQKQNKQSKQKQSGRKFSWSNANDRLRFWAFIFTLLSGLLMLYPMVFTFTSSMKDSTQIYQIPPTLSPGDAQSVSVVYDYSDSNLAGEELKNNVLQDSVYTMMALDKELTDDGIMEIKVYGIQNGKTIYYSRVHKMNIQMERDYGVYQGALVKPKVLSNKNKHLQFAENVGYDYDVNGINQELPTGLETKFQDKAANVMAEKFPTTGKLQSVGNKQNNALNFESFRYYLRMPKYLYPKNATIQKFGFNTFVLNTIIVIGFAIISQVFLCSICGFVISKSLSRKAGNAVLLFFLAGMMIPFVSIMLPQFIMFQHMGAYNNYAALLLPFLYPYGFYVYLFKGSFDKIPNSYFEAGKLDGASTWFLYSQICMPLSKPIISMIALQTFIGNWNDFFWAWLVTEDQNLWTLNVAIYNISNNSATRQNAVMGVSVITVLPVILLTLIFSKQLKKTIIGSGVKG